MIKRSFLGQTLYIQSGTFAYLLGYYILFHFLYNVTQIRYFTAISIDISSIYKVKSYFNQ